MYRVIRKFSGGLAVLSLVACSGGFDSYRDTNVTIASKADFDPQRYLGLWYEIARFPVPFQDGCFATTAEYELFDDGDIGVINTCRDGAVDGPRRRIEGVAQITGPGRLAVRFDTIPLVSAPYWVLWVDESYRTAVVGVPSGRAGWILNRDPAIPADRLNAAREILDFNGYDLTALEMVPQVTE